MTYHAILTASIFLLVAFAIERFSRAFPVPSVIVLIAAGLAGKPLLAHWGLTLEGLDRAVPILGTVGLVLIVLEGALDIQLRRDRLRAIGSALVLATAGFVACTAILATIAFLALGLPPLQATIMAVPFAVISSAVAIPSSQHLPSAGREFIVYESAISDILGVMFFLSLVNSDGTPAGVMMALAGGGLLSLLLAVVFAIGLALVLMRIDGHIRFIPLLSGLFGLYAAGELLHLSPLMLVLLFGLALNNPTLLTRFRPVQRWLDDSYESTLAEFKMLILELAFAVRGFFFILLGYWTNLTDLMSLHAWIGAGLVLAVIYLSRRLLLRLARLEMADALTWLAPRGLVTVLLFLTAGNHHELPAFLDGTVMLVVLVSATLTAAGRSRRAEAAQVPAPAPEPVSAAGQEGDREGA